MGGPRPKLAAEPARHYFIVQNSAVRVQHLGLRPQFPDSFHRKPPLNTFASASQYYYYQGRQPTDFAFKRVFLRVNQCCLERRQFNRYLTYARILTKVSLQNHDYSGRAACSRPSIAITVH